MSAPRRLGTRRRSATWCATLGRRTRPVVLLALPAALLAAACGGDPHGAAALRRLPSAALTDVAHVLGRSQLGPWSRRRCRFLRLPSRVVGVDVSGRREECYAALLSSGAWHGALGSRWDRRPSPPPRQASDRARRRAPVVNELLVIVSVRFGSHRQAAREMGPLLRLAVTRLDSVLTLRPRNPAGTIMALAPKPLYVPHSGLGVSITQGRCASALVLLGLRVLNGPLELGKLGILGMVQQASLARGAGCR
jgi:hypothetical protein